MRMAKPQPKDKATKILGVPNRLLFIAIFTVSCVAVESILNAMGVLIWDFRYWGWPHVLPIVLFAYLPSILFLYWLFDMKSLRRKLAIASSLVVLDVVGFVVFGPVLGWL